MTTLQAIGGKSKVFAGIAVVLTMGLLLSVTVSADAGSVGVNTNQQLRLQNRESAVKAAVTADRQSSNGYVVTVASVTYPNNAMSTSRAREGVVIVAPLVHGAAGDPIGFATVRHGKTRNVKVRLQVRLNTGTYRVSLYPGARPPSHEPALAWTNVSVFVS